MKLPPRLTTLLKSWGRIGTEEPPWGYEPPPWDGGPTRDITDSELNDMLSAHEQWVNSRDSGSPSGCQANLRRANLKGKFLNDRKLQGANLSGADFRGADLNNADLQGTDLRGANLEGAILTAANLQDTLLRGAHLANATLSEATGLLPEQLADTNLRRAKLPDKDFEFEALGKVDELSKNSGVLFLSMLVSCVFTWLTIATTSDPALLANSISSKLPVIDVEIPIVGFYWAAPFLLFGVYLYFHLYLQRLWETMTTLPAIFPDGMSLDRKTHAWLMNDLVRAHFLHLKESRPPFSWVQEKLSVFLGWWVVPLTMLMLWGRYLTRRDWLVTGLHIALLGCTLWAGLLFYRIAVATLRNFPKETIAWRKPWRYYRFYWRGAYGLLVGAELWLFSFAAITTYYKWEKLTNFDPRTPTGVVLDWVRGSSLVDFTEAAVSSKPDEWKKDELYKVKGAYLRNANLHHLAGGSAFLAKADLREANLQEAMLQRADLRAADLIKANLHSADLSGADLQDAYLSEMDLRQTHLTEANLQGAHLSKAQLQNQDLAGVNLRGADLSDANLHRASLNGADLQDAQLSGADLQGAELNGANLQKAGIIGTNLQEADLSSANLRDAVLNEAKLQNARLGDADLQRADLSNADLQNANLMSAKLQNAKLGDAKLQKVDLSNADLQNAILFRAGLQGAELGDANLQSAKLNKAELQDAKLERAQLQNAQLRSVDLQNADLREANLQNTYLRGARLQNADLRGADLQKADLRGADLQNAKLGEVDFEIKTDLRGADLSGANLKSVDLSEVLNLTMDQIRTARIDPETTKLPDYLKQKTPQKQPSTKHGRRRHSKRL